MRVLLIGNFAPDRQESMLRFSRLLTHGLRDRGHEVSTWSPEPKLVRLLPRYRYGGPMKFVGYVDKFLLFPRSVRSRLAREHQADIVHIVDHANSVYAPLFARGNVLATCHDLLQIRASRGEFSQHKVTGLGRRYQSWILENISRLPQVVVPSRQTAVDLQRLTGMSSDRIDVIPLALNFPYQRMTSSAARLVVGKMLRERDLAPGALEHSGRGFLLNVGGGQWYKNRQGLLEIYAELRRLMNPAPRLVMVGKPLAPEHEALLHRLNLSDDVIRLSHLTEAQLQALYSIAEGLLFPSWHEGFGWPVAEAQACGCPVFTSDRAPMTEVGGDAACYLDPADPQESARRIAFTWPRRSDMSRRGLERTSEWSESLMFDRYLDVYARMSKRCGKTVAP
jgi:glycosyltransferase involved in cell wall biosynthesis